MNMKIRIVNLIQIQKYR